MSAWTFGSVDGRAPISSRNWVAVAHVFLHDLGGAGCLPTCFHVESQPKTGLP